MENNSANGTAVKKLSKGKVWCFAVGQFGWSVLAALISSWLVNYYQPDKAAIDDGQTLFLPEGRVIFGILTILGAITAGCSTPLRTPWWPPRPTNADRRTGGASPSCGRRRFPSPSAAS